MELFGLVTDTLEQSALGDSRWLDAAIAVLAGADEAARCDLRDVLAAIDHGYSLPSRSAHGSTRPSRPFPLAKNCKTFC